VVIVTLTLGIGLNAAIFSVAHAVLWRSLPYPEVDRLVMVEADTRAVPSASSSTGPLFDVAVESRALVNVAQVEGRDASIAVNGMMERVAGARVTDDLGRRWGATSSRRS
jgi:putative ABC transport system permease protein